MVERLQRENESLRRLGGKQTRAQETTQVRLEAENKRLKVRTHCNSSLNVCSLLGCMCSYVLYTLGAKSAASKHVLYSCTHPVHYNGVVTYHCLAAMIVTPKYPSIYSGVPL